MKSFNYHQARILFGALPIMGGLLFTGCGGSSGGGGTTLPNQNYILPDNYTLVSPAADATGVCTFPTFKIHFPGSDMCGLSDLSNTVGLIPQGSNTSVGLTGAISSLTSDGGCDYLFNPKSSLNGLTTYSWGVFDGASVSAVNLKKDSRRFTTAEANMVNCGDDATGRFYIENTTFPIVNVPFTTINLNKVLIETSGSSFGNMIDGKWSSNLSWDSALSTIQGAFNPTIVSYLASSVSADKSFVITFNEKPNPLTIDGAIFVAKKTDGEEQVQVRVQPGVPTEKSITILPPTGGYVSGKTFVVVIYPSILGSSGRVLSASGKNTAITYMFYFKT